MRRNVPLTKLQKRVLRSILKSHGAACAAPSRHRKRRSKMTRAQLIARRRNIKKALRARWK